MTARDEVLAHIRSALVPSPAPAGSSPTLVEVPPGLVEVPRSYRRSGTLQGEALLSLLVERLVDYKATVHRCTDPRSVLPSLVEGRVLLPFGFAFDGGTVDDDFGPDELDGFDTVVTACAAACAQTGTIVLDGSPDQGRRAISLVPDRHVCVVRAEQVVETVPELLARLDPTRPLTFISGPSATSDIELERVEGVHGPRTLIVVLVSAT
jgi:L-lactate dehydrogenase complex protein LldG